MSKHHQALTKKILELVRDKKRLEFLITLVTNSEWITIQEFPEGFRLYTPERETRICDTIREAIDSAMDDDYFKRV